MLSYSLHLQLYIIQSTEKTLVKLLIAWCPWHFDENVYGKNLKGMQGKYHVDFETNFKALFLK